MARLDCLRDARKRKISDNYIKLVMFFREFRKELGWLRLDESCQVADAILIGIAGGEIYKLSADIYASDFNAACLGKIDSIEARPCSEIKNPLAIFDYLRGTLNERNRYLSERWHETTRLK